MFSEEQAKDYYSNYKIPTSTLFKSGNFESQPAVKLVNNPIKLVYAGRLYCNRWKTLAAIGNALKTINANGTKITLDIYTQEDVTSKQLKALSPNNYLRLNKAVTSSELQEIYRNADIALHVESFDKKYRYATRVSFSTKIIDLMASTCAIMAICWDKHAGFQYLKKHDAAFCVSNYDEIKITLQKIVENSDLITEFSRKAWSCGTENHTAKIIHKDIYTVFEKTIFQNKT